MLYVCIPTHNEAVTVGVLLWRLRTTLREQAGGRDYEVVVYDDASTDATADVLAPYGRVLPLTLLRGDTRIGQSAAVDALVRHVVARSHAPETDALLLLQADYTDSPDLVGEILPLFDAGADVVLTRRVAALDQPLGERRLRRAAAVLLPPLVRSALSDPVAREPIALLSTMRLFRVTVLRDALRASGSAPLVRAPGWAGTAELVVRTAPFARRIERVEAPARYDVRVRPSRIEWTRELRAIAALLWQRRSAARATERDDARLARPTRAPSAGAAPRIAPRVGPASAPAASAEQHAEGPDAGTARPTGPRIVHGTTMDFDVSEATATARPARRRRRGRGRAGAPDPSAALGEATSSDAAANGPLAGAPPNAPDLIEPANADPGGAEPLEAESSDAEPAADGTAESPARRRRRRGGARRRTRGPESDTGVSPEKPDASANPWQGAPSDQPSS